MPFAEAKTCTDYASGCSFCPCGAMRLLLRGATLTVNEQEVMLLHLAQSKYAWRRSGISLPPWTPAWAGGCFEVRHLGLLNESCAACSRHAPAFVERGVPGAVERATRLVRHRVQSSFRGHIVYASTARDEVRLEAAPCA
mmetsp:Transcript_11521/g.26586  ORF Transcript_11521/g.26586 Transcript_11521/m.26586 type:complete len:140 (+) Transcript_11521:867-1286(+)